MYLPPIPHLWNRRSSQVRSEGWRGIDRIFQERGEGIGRSHQMYVPFTALLHIFFPFLAESQTWQSLVSLNHPAPLSAVHRSRCVKPPPPHCSRSAPPVLITDLVYNSRKRGGDSADRYFKATEMIAGVKDMRFQAIMPDTLHWLGVQKIDNMISMVSSSLRSSM